MGCDVIAILFNTGCLPYVLLLNTFHRFIFAACTLMCSRANMLTARREGENRKMTAKKAKVVPVSIRGLYQRINRALSNRGELLRATRGESLRRKMGDFYIVSLKTNALVKKSVDIEKVGRKLKVLQPWEGLIEIRAARSSKAPKRGGAK